MNAIVALQNSGYIVSGYRYNGGTNYVISKGNKSVSVCETDDGLFDVQAPGMKVLYTGNNGQAAAFAAMGYLR